MRFFIVAIVFGISLFASELNWTHDYEQALKTAKKEHKLVYLLITSTTCKWCKKFEATTLQDPEIKKRLYSEFIPVNLVRDIEKVPKQFATAPIPRHYFLNAKGDILYSSLGHRGVTCFDAFMDNAQQKLKITQ